MNVLSLFDGISCGKVALNEIGVKVDNYYASEVKNFAMRCSRDNHDDITYIGDVTKISYKDGILKTENGDFNVGNIDLLIGGSPCFIAGTKIITKYTYKNIEDVNVDDLVITHTGKYKKVLKTGGKLSNTLIVKAQGVKPTETTEEHPFYVRSMNREWDNSNRKYYRKFTDPYWKEAKNLTEGDFIGININTLEENTLNLTSEECYILGRYIADGHTRKDYRNSENRNGDRYWQLILSIGNEKLKDFKRNISENNFSCYPHSESVHRVVFSNKRLVEIAERYCGCGAKNKIIPQLFINLPIPLLKNVLDGYFDGDGSSTGDVFKATSISEQLIMTLSQAIAKVYRVNASYEYTKRPETCIIEGRVVNQNDTYSISFRKTMKIQSRAKVIEDIIWLPIKSIEYTNNIKMVYNLEVEEDNSYTANNIIVHNCQDFSILNTKRLGLNGEKSKLFYEFLRLKNEINPKYFLLENVKMKKNSEIELNKYLGVDGIHINSNLLTFQSRPRIYWTNIPNVTIPEDLKVNFQDYKDTDYEYQLKFKVNKTPSREKMWNNGNGKVDVKSCKNITHSEKIGCLTRKQDRSPNSGLIEFDGFCRYLTTREMELAQGLPVGYTKSLSMRQAEDVLGDGWTVSVISHIFKGLK